MGIYIWGREGGNLKSKINRKQNNKKPIENTNNKINQIFRILIQIYYNVVVCWLMFQSHNILMQNTLSYSFHCHSCTISCHTQTASHVQTNSKTTTT